MHKFITSSEVVKAVKIKPLVDAIEDAYVNLDKYVLTPRIFSNTRDDGDCLLAGAVNLRTERQLVRGSSYSPWRKPAVMGHFMLLNYDTGDFLAVVDGTEIISFRTGAKSAVAAKYLAKKSSKTLGLIGIGTSAKIHAEAICSVLPIERILGYSRNPGQWTDQLTYIKEHTGIEVELVDMDTLKGNSDVIVLSTWTENPILKSADLHPGQLIISTAHAEEVSKEIPLEFGAFVDTVEAAKGELGPVKLALADGAAESIIKGALKDVIAGKVGRKSDTEIVYFQSLGCTHEDMTVVEYVYENC
jgi:ornithine cyclodeaminase/alanine dehydrogenase-like protein (mu-crystallin family)